MKTIRRKQFSIDWYHLHQDEHYELLTIKGQPSLASYKAAMAYARHHIPEAATHYDIRQRVDSWNPEGGWHSDWESVREGPVSELNPTDSDPIMSIFRALHPNAVLLGEGPTIVQGKATRRKTTGTDKKKGER